MGHKKHKKAYAIARIDQLKQKKTSILIFYLIIRQQSIRLLIFIKKYTYRYKGYILIISISLLGMNNPDEQVVQKEQKKGFKKVGKYVIDLNKVLGRGNYGTVYIAEDQQTKEDVAVKIISKAQILQDSYIKNAFIRQMQIMKNLKSGNIIQYIQPIETKNNLYIFLQLANQGSLADLLQQKKRFAEDVAVKYILQILNAFRQLIEHGVVHRDIKPANFLIKNNKLKLTDFNQACYSKSSDMGAYTGTPFYMSPQVLLGEKYSYKCDIWSLGTLLYELVVGLIPWVIKIDSCSQQPQTILELENLIKQRTQNGIYFPEDLKVSQDYKDLVRGCLKFQEGQRFGWTQIFHHKLFAGKIKNLQKINTNPNNFVNDL